MQGVRRMQSSRAQARRQVVVPMPRARREGACRLPMGRHRRRKTARTAVGSAASSAPHHAASHPAYRPQPVPQDRGLVQHAQRLRKQQGPPALTHAAPAGQPRSRRCTPGQPLGTGGGREQEARRRTHRALHGLAAVCAKGHARARSRLVLLQTRSATKDSPFRRKKLQKNYLSTSRTHVTPWQLENGRGQVSRCRAGRTPTSPKRIVAGQQTLTMRSRPISRAHARGN